MAKSIELDDKKYSKALLGKVVVSKTGKKFGEVANIVFETRTGELLQVVIKNPTTYIAGLDLERDPEGKLLLPFSSVIAVGDFVVIAEEDIV